MAEPTLPWDEEGPKMTEEQRRKIVRLAALRLMHLDVPNAPAGAVGPPSKWWTQAEEVVTHILPYIEECYDV
jgi:hypothetical protein